MKKNPWILFVISFVSFILLGSILLLLPPFHRTPISYIDALFTSTSAMCVTGLTVKDTGRDFTTSGQIVILILIQIGGLGIMTFTVAGTLLIGRKVGGGTKEIIGEQFSGEFGNVRAIVKAVLIYTLVIEVIGTLALYPFLRKGTSDHSPFFSSIFHSISAFCNAGFSLFSTSFEWFASNPLFLLSVSFLIFAGGIGFLNGVELLKKIRNTKRHLSLNAKIAVSTSLILIIGGTLLIFICEYKNWGSDLSSLLINSLFQSVTARTAGFNSLKISSLTGGTLFILLILMMIGATSGSCGGGIKTTTVGVIFAYIKSEIKGFKETVIFNTSIEDEIISKALNVFFFYIVTMTAGALLLLITNYSHLVEKGITNPTFPILFETVSALSTVGLSFGITPLFNTIGKIIIILLMLTGRIGFITLIFGILVREKESVPYTYPKERVMIG